MGIKYNLNFTKQNTEKVSWSKKVSNGILEKQKEEETFDEFEERIESNIYEASKALREGKKETMLLESEMRSV